VRELGHAPRFSFEQGLRLTLDWYRAQREMTLATEPVGAKRA
jgi:nucleoside-diphosphate-sugar epimerase